MSTTETIEREADAVMLVEPPEAKDALAVFATEDGKGADPILAMIRSKIDVFLGQRPDVATSAGRDVIRAFAHRITKSKTALEAVRKELADEQKKIPKLIDATGRHINKTLEAWHEEVRKPLTDWEKAKKEREAFIKNKLAHLQFVIDDHAEHSSESLRDLLDDIEAAIPSTTEADFDDYAAAAAELKSKAIDALRARISVAERREAEAAELTKLRAEAVERERQDRERKIAEEAATKAAADAEARLAEERERANRAEQARKDAEQRAVDAARKARQDAEFEAAQKHEAEEAEKKRREQDRVNRAEIHRAALAALMEGGLDEQTGKTVVTLIAQGKVPRVQINY